MASLRSNAEWGEKVLKSDPAALAELRDLAKLVGEGGDLDALIVAAPDAPDTNVNGELSLRKVAGEIPRLSAAGIFGWSYSRVSRKSHSYPAGIDAVRRFKAMRHSSPAWVDDYLAGEHEEVRESRLMSMF